LDRLAFDGHLMVWNILICLEMFVAAKYDTFPPRKEARGSPAAPSDAVTGYCQPQELLPSATQCAAEGTDSSIFNVEAVSIVSSCFKTHFTFNLERV
jgi:hypothetical protein